MNIHREKYFDSVNSSQQCYPFRSLPTHVPISELPFTTKSQFLYNFYQNILSLIMLPELPRKV